MESGQKFGQWEVIDTIKHNRVYEVSHPDYKGRYVLKQARENELFTNEIEVLKCLKEHPNIITLVDYGERWHVTEWVDFNFRYENITYWPDEWLEDGHINELIDELVRTFGYCHSQGIAVGCDFEILINAKGHFVIADLENAQVWENHHIDTTDDLYYISGVINSMKNIAQGVLKRRRQEQNQRCQVMAALGQAPPSAPRRLAE
jgi:serine/threonine protein kinase